MSDDKLLECLPSGVYIHDVDWTYDADGEECRKHWTMFIAWDEWDEYVNKADAYRADRPGGT